MKVGITAKADALDRESLSSFACKTEQLGFDGVFLFDHFWPVGNFDGATLSPEIAAAFLFGLTKNLNVGTLVIRAGMRSVEETANIASSLITLGGERLILGLGIGDHLSAQEESMLGIPNRLRSRRVSELKDLVKKVITRDCQVWIGGLRLYNELGEDLKPKVYLNLWMPNFDKIIRIAKSKWLSVAQAIPAYVDQRRPKELYDWLREYELAGVKYLVVCWPRHLDELACAYSKLCENNS